jgi:hypothetical protein
LLDPGFCTSFLPKLVNIAAARINASFNGTSVKRKAPQEIVIFARRFRVVD